ncbi:cytochrome P450 89A2-like protein [Cinnamomum micranthum f. kanehirae]|uniref:Cytochrome P450 89A2-like protein n=1 Tax=Cinnamomum micranthum f. kanehirae TaxID=337451 RepID=A0A3S4PI51_9MAGN|nr:cytochrome P450 89A2-like protein [Cinnamomum micranthum f. kanehirae]
MGFSSPMWILYYDLEHPHEEGRKLKEEEMVSLCKEFLNGGWIMANLAKHQDMQDKPVEETKRVMEKEKEVTEEHLGMLSVSIDGGHGGSGGASIFFERGQAKGFSSRSGELKPRTETDPRRSSSSSSSPSATGKTTFYCLLPLPRQQRSVLFQRMKQQNFASTWPDPVPPSVKSSINKITHPSPRLPTEIGQQESRVGQGTEIDEMFPHQLLSNQHNWINSTDDGRSV